MSYKLKINNSYESEPSSCSVSPVCDNNFSENKNSFDDQQIIIGPNKLSELLKPSSSSSVLDQSTDDIAVEKQEPLNLKKLVTNNPIGLRKIDKLNNFENEIKNKKIKNKCDASLHKQICNNDDNDDDDNNIEDSPSPGKLIIDEDTSFLSNSKKFHKNNQQEIIIKKQKLTTKNVNEILLQQNNHHFENLNERSPDLFDNIDDESEEVIDEKIQILTNFENDELINNITETVVNIENSDKEILKRIKLSLSGVPPPPSITISQVDILNAVIENKENIFNFYKEFKTIPTQTDTIKENKTSDKVDDNDNDDADDDDDDDDDDDQCKDSISTFNDSLFKPTHSLDEMKNISWPDILNVKQHGLCYNISNVREKIELLCLSVVERYVGVETSSSFQGVPANSRRTSARLRTMMQSPGSRLSHLAKRRAAFSSATLQSTFQKKIPKSIVIDSKKSDNRRKSKIKTPKRKTPGKNKIENFFLTQKPPTSSASSSLSISSKISNTSSFLSYSMKSNAPATRETSKRALFQSPTSEIIKPIINVPKSVTIKPEIATRVEKSKRALFSPDKQSTYKNSSKANIENELKRKRDNDDDNNSNNSFNGNPYKMLRSDFENLTPRSLKFKSQSFCSSSGTNSINSSFQNVKSKSLFRASSDTVCSNQLTESHRKKLLWAVSQALQTKHIDFSHPKFKQYAAVLARAIKRLFLEFYLNIKNTSTSDTMLRLSKKYVHHAISNMSADDIYLNEKNRLEQEKYNLTIKKLSIGYIGPEDYENKILLKNSNNHKLNNKLPSSIFSDNSCDSFNLLSQTNYCSQISSSTEFLSQISQDILLSKNQNNIENFDSLIDCNNGTIKLKDNSELITSTISSTSSSSLLLSPSLSSSTISSTALQNNSSSKNNLYGVALRENVDCELRKSAQKNFTGKDMKNKSPFIDNISSYRNNSNNMTITTTAITASNHKNSSSVDLNALRAKRQISFDN